MSNSIASETVQRRARTSVASDAAILMTGFILSRVLGLVRVMIQGSVLGATGKVPAAFTAAISFPDFMFTLVSGGALASSFIPVFAGMLELGDEEDAWRVASGVMNGVLIVMACAVVVAELAAPAIVTVLAPPSGQQLTLQLTRIMLLQPLFLSLSGILMGIHNSYHRFIAPVVAPVVYNLACIAGLLLVRSSHDGVTMAAWGVTIGALLQVVVLAPGLGAFGRLIGPGVGVREPGAREIGRLMVPRVIGQAGIQFSTLVMVALANQTLQGSPSAAIRYSSTLMALPVGIFGGAMATAVFPTLAGHAARGDLHALAASVSRTLQSMMFLSIPAAIGLILLRYPITEVVYYRGNFRAGDVDLVSIGLLMWGLGIPVLAAVELLPRAFFALKDTWTPVLINLVTLATAVALSVAAALVAAGNSAFGVGALTGIVSLTVAIEVTWLGVTLKRRLPGLSFGPLGLTVLRSLVAGEAMGVALLALLFIWHHYGPAGPLGDLVLLVVAVPLGVGVYAGWSYVVGAPELVMAWSLLRRRLEGIRRA